MRVIIAGSRTIDDISEIEGAIDYALISWNLDLSAIKEIVSGGARGADQLGECFAFENNISIKKFVPNWDAHRKIAGLIRNAEMAKYADKLIAIWDGKSTGTGHMISTMKHLGKDVVVRYVINGGKFNERT